jgi:hypothetical protein
MPFTSDHITQPTSFTAAKSSYPFLSWEIIDEILILAGNAKTAAKLQRYTIFRKIDSQADFNWAIRHGFLGYLKYFNKRNHCTGRYDYESMQRCVALGFFSVLKYCHQCILPITNLIPPSFRDHHLLDVAAVSGNLDIIKYLHSMGSKCTPMTMDLAASRGHLEIVKFFHENRREGCTTSAMDAAASDGRLDIVKFLHDN